MVVRARSSYTAFLLAAGVVLAVCIGLLRSSLFARSPEIGALGVACDISLTIPLLYYLCVVRSGRAPLVSLLPVFLICLAVANRVVPAGHLPSLGWLRLLAAPLELVSIGSLVVCARQALRNVRTAEAQTGDAFERFQLGVRAAFGNNRLLEFLVTEIAFVYYGLFAWRRRVSVPEGATATTCYKKSGWSTILGVLIFLILIESTIVHLVLQRWSGTAVWIWDALDLYGILWLLGDYQALRLRPLLLTPDALHVRFGLRWSGTVPLHLIERIEKVSFRDPTPKGPDVLKIALLSEPEYVVTLREPVTFQGLLGRQKAVRHLTLCVDDAQLFERLRKRLSL